MPGITLEQAQTQLAQYLAAETAVLLGQEYQIAGRKLVRADLAAIQEGVTLWNKRVQDLEARAAGKGRAIAMRPGW